MAACAFGLSPRCRFCVFVSTLVVCVCVCEARGCLGRVSAWLPALLGPYASAPSLALARWVAACSARGASGRHLCCLCRACAVLVMAWLLAARAVGNGAAWPALARAVAARAVCGAGGCAVCCLCTRSLQHSLWLLERGPPDCAARSLARVGMDCGTGRGVARLLGVLGFSLHGHLCLRLATSLLASGFVSPCARARASVCVCVSPRVAHGCLGRAGGVAVCLACALRALALLAHQVAESCPVALLVASATLVMA